jgi:3-dehydrosphinganine reductase
MKLNYSDRVVVVTGGSSGLGAALAERIAARGAKLAIIARDATKLEATASALRRTGATQVLACPCDVADEARVLATFERIRGALGAPWMVINSAGVLLEGYFHEQSAQAFRDIFDVNFFGALNVCRASVDDLESSQGHLVNVASVGGLMGAFGYSAYCASKHALCGLTEVLQQELAPRGVHTHLVCPPEFASPMTAGLDDRRTPENQAITHSIKPMSLEAVTSSTLAGLDRGDYLIINGAAARTTVRFSRWCPGLTARIARSRIARVYRGPARAVRPR